MEAIVLEAEMVEIGGMIGGRLEKTNVFDIWFAFKPLVGIDRRLDVYKCTGQTGSPGRKKIADKKMN